MALNLLILSIVADVSKEGWVLEGLSFEARGESSGEGQTTVLSCGGIYVPQRSVPEHMKNWRQIVNLPGSHLSAKIFAYDEGDEQEADPLEMILRQESLN